MVVPVEQEGTGALVDDAANLVEVAAVDEVVGGVQAGGHVRVEQVVRADDHRPVVHECQRRDVPPGVEVQVVGAGEHMLGWRRQVGGRDGA